MFSLDLELSRYCISRLEGFLMHHVKYKLGMVLWDLPLAIHFTSFFFFFTLFSQRHVDTWPPNLYVIFVQTVVTKVKEHNRIGLCTLSLHWNRFQHYNAPVHKVSSMETRFATVGVQDLECPSQGPDLNPTEHLCGEPQCRVKSSACPYYCSCSRMNTNLVKAFLKE